ncbi:ABC-three component system middle component 1 [Rahnella perminowiae]|uniref:ABC-three component system middle component 1 n=1 Tax=Rahnella perminowiae TaxID=2816244 RepID=UPI001C262A6B|nr:ABC-three component system middle component 1 [Rahnella perminowiae]MBU9824912.1 hypothetical protein [Rahnella perminowiae]
MHLLSKDFDLDFLSTRFEALDFQLFVSNDDISYMSCIACWCEKSSQVVDNWGVIQNYLSGYYQPPGDIALWNTYLAFFCVETLPLWEKYKIQNDKYAVRKLVLDGTDKVLSYPEALTLLNNHLLGADLELTERDMDTTNSFSLSLGDYVRGTPLDSRVESREDRARRIDNIIKYLSQDENKKS